MLVPFDGTFERDLTLDAAELLTALVLAVLTATIAAGLLGPAVVEGVPLVIQGDNGLLDWLILN